MSTLVVTVPRVGISAPAPIPAARVYLGGVPNRPTGGGTTAGRVGFAQSFQAQRAATVNRIAVGHISDVNTNASKIIEVVDDNFTTVLAQTAVFTGGTSIFGDPLVYHDLVAPLSLVSGSYYWVCIRNVDAAGGDALRVHYQLFFDGLAKKSGGIQSDIQWAAGQGGNPDTTTHYDSLAVASTATYNDWFSQTYVTDTIHNGGAGPEGYLCFGMQESVSRYTPQPADPALTWTRMADSPAYADNAGDSDSYGWFVEYAGKFYRRSYYIGKNEGVKIYDPTNDTWSIVPATYSTDPAEPGSDQGGVLVGNTVWVTGLSSAGLAAIFPLNLDTMVWGVQYPVFPAGGFPSAAINAMPPVLIGRKVYSVIQHSVASGQPTLDRMAAFDLDSLTWTLLAFMPVGVGYTGLLTDGVDIYMPMGYKDNNPTGTEQDDTNIDSRLMRRYVPATDQWELLAPAPLFRTLNDAHPFYANGFIYMWGASDDNNDGAGYDTNMVNAYDIATDRWITQPARPFHFSEGTSLVAQGRAWLSGAETSNVSGGTDNFSRGLLRSSLFTEVPPAPTFVTKNLTLPYQGSATDIATVTVVYQPSSAYDPAVDGVYDSAAGDTPIHVKHGTTVQATLNSVVPAYDHTGAGQTPTRTLWHNSGEQTSINGANLGTQQTGPWAVGQTLTIYIQPDTNDSLVFPVQEWADPNNTTNPTFTDQYAGILLIQGVPG